MKKPKVLIVEDEPDIVDLVTYNLSRSGFEVASCKDGESGLLAARAGGVDLVILDIMLPGIDGLEVCRRLRADAAVGATPVIMLTSKSEESDVVIGLGIGADDYVTKPFSPRELVARVKACLRRREQVRDAGERVLCFSGIEIDPVRYSVVIDGQSVPFTLTEFRLLHVLASAPGHVFSRSELLPRVIGEGAFVIDRNIDTHVRNIRKKLGKRAQHLVTLRGVGYKFEP